MPTDSHRLKILSNDEIEELYCLPRFSEEDRHIYFDLSTQEREAVDAHTVSVAAHLILQFGYFKAKRQFFNFVPDNIEGDLLYILERYFPGKDMVSIKTPSRPTILVHQQIILKLFDYRICDISAKEELEQKARRTAMLSTQPIYILRETLLHLTNQRIVAPSYTSLQDIVGRVVSYERNRVAQLLIKSLTPEIEIQLDALLQADEQVYRINALKREPKDFGYNELRREV